MKSLQQLLQNKESTVKSQLVNGRIPVGQQCPFAQRCPSKINGDCGHHGPQHEVAYICWFARLFDSFGEPTQPETPLKGN